MMRSEYRPLVDMNILPRVQYRKDRNQVNWNMVIGMELPFECGDTSGRIVFIEKHNDKVLIERIIDNSNNIKKVWITKTAVIKNNLSHSIFNEIAFTCPDLLKYFVNKEDAYKLTKTSLESAFCKCPICGYVKSYTMATLHSRGFKCDKCSDKSFKYPNKFMMNVLDQTNYQYQAEVTKTTKGFDWLKNYRYDFLIVNKKCFIEMDGYFHFNDNLMNGRTVEEQQKIDMYKDKLAHEHGYDIIRINCYYKNIQNRFDFIKNNIIKSNLMSLLHINEDNIDWDECDKQAISNTLYVICDLWNSGIHHSRTIAKELGLSWSCVHENLLKGAKIGLCDYDPGVASRMKNEKQKRENGIPVAVLKNGSIVGIFISGRELARQSLEKFGHLFDPGYISRACHNQNITCFGYTIKHISHEEYDNYLKQLNKTIQN